jgi:TATA-box binding protein (TBP) (component of TFIID and TFIIIB)
MSDIHLLYGAFLCGGIRKKMIMIAPNIICLHTPLLTNTTTMTDINFTIPTMNISPVRISTMVTTAHVGTLINLDALFQQVPILPYWDLTDGILKMEYRANVKGTSWKDILQKRETVATEDDDSDEAPATPARRTFFFNQATLVIRREVAPLQWKEINIKLFRNGGVQMTGVRSEAMSWDAIRWLTAHIQATCLAAPVFEGPVAIHKMQIQLVNTDFSIGAKIRREALYKILSERYYLTVSYEPSIYQGVKTKYFYNAERPASCPPGLCPCEKLCKGTGDGSGLGKCKKITISPFQTGQIIITGARTMTQIEEAYEFMKGVFQTHAGDILRKNYICPTDALDTAPTTAATTKKVGWIHHPSPRNIFHIPLCVMAGEKPSGDGPE